MKSHGHNNVSVETEMAVHIPTPDGKKVAETIMVKVPALKDLKTGEIYLTGDALRILDRAKARRMGILLPYEIKELREQLSLSQKDICELLGMGLKTYTRWESGRERPSQSLNRMLVALWEGRLNLADLREMRQPACSWYELLSSTCRNRGENRSYAIKASPQVEEAHNEICCVAA